MSRPARKTTAALPMMVIFLRRVSPHRTRPTEPLHTAMVDPDPASIKGEGNVPARSHSRVPPDLVDARGDDIIARQLREAAMKEDDPELREKLWDEYRKYRRDLR